VTATEILRELVAIPTPSSVSNLPLLHWVHGFLEPFGWHLEWMEWTDDKGVVKANLFAFAGPNADAPIQAPIDLAFICHTDTVPYAAAWSTALKLEERSGSLHGCGSCDVKGALACFLAAIAAIDISRLHQRIAMILTADEEVGCKGIEKLLASEQYGNLHIRSAIVSEPTSLRAGIAGKGYGLARITVQGREAHSAFPSQGASAITAAARLITQIEDKFSEKPSDVKSEASTLFDPSLTTVNIGVIQGGSAKNIIAGECSFLVEWRSLPEEIHGAVTGILQQFCQAAQQAQPAVRIQLQPMRDERGFAPSHAGRLRHQLHKLLPASPTGISFGSEASRLARIADEIIVIGPGDMRTAHSERECVSVSELEIWTRVLNNLLQNMD